MRRKEEDTKSGVDHYLFSSATIASTRNKTILEGIVEQEIDIRTRVADDSNYGLSGGVPS